MRVLGIDLGWILVAGDVALGAVFVVLAATYARRKARAELAVGNVRAKALEGSDRMGERAADAGLACLLYSILLLIFIVAAFFDPGVSNRRETEFFLEEARGWTKVSVSVDGEAYTFTEPTGDGGVRKFDVPKAQVVAYPSENGERRAELWESYYRYSTTMDYANFLFPSLPLPAEYAEGPVVSDWEKDYGLEWRVYSPLDGDSAAVLGLDAE